MNHGAISKLNYCALVVSYKWHEKNFSFERGVLRISLIFMSFSRHNLHMHMWCYAFFN